MQIIDVADQRTLPASVVTIGSFDGVHRGHKQLLNSLRQIGTKAGLRTALVTFDRIPRAVISPEAAPPLLCNIETRLDLLRQTGLVDYCCVLPFDEQRQRETVDDLDRKSTRLHSSH